MGLEQRGAPNGEWSMQWAAERYRTPGVKAVTRWDRHGLAAVTYEVMTGTAMLSAIDISLLVESGKRKPGFAYVNTPNFDRLTVFIVDELAKVPARFRDRDTVRFSAEDRLVVGLDGARIIQPHLNFTSAKDDRFHVSLEALPL